MSEVCVKCGKNMRLFTYTKSKTLGGFICGQCNKEEINERLKSGPVPEMKGLRIGLGVVSIISAITLFLLVFT